MIEDKLKPNERIRLEALKQAVEVSPVGASDEYVLGVANKFKRYIMGIENG